MIDPTRSGHAGPAGAEAGSSPPYAAPPASAPPFLITDPRDVIRPRYAETLKRASAQVSVRTKIFCSETGGKAFSQMEPSRNWKAGKVAGTGGRR